MRFTLQFNLALFITIYKQVSGELLQSLIAKASHFSKRPDKFYNLVEKTVIKKIRHIFYAQVILCRDTGTQYISTYKVF